MATKRFTALVTIHLIQGSSLNLLLRRLYGYEIDGIIRRHRYLDCGDR